MRPGERNPLPPLRSLLPLGAMIAAAFLAGCGEEEETPEPGGRPKLGEAAPELLVYLTAPPKKARVFVEPTEEVYEPEEFDLAKLVAGAPAVIHFDAASTHLAERQSKVLAGLAAEPAETPQPAEDIRFVTVVLGDEAWPGASGAGKLYHARRREALAAYGCDLLPMIVIVDADGNVRHVGGFTRAKELAALLEKHVASSGGSGDGEE